MAIEPKTSHSWVIPIVLFAVLHTGTAIWWASNLSSSVENLNERVLQIVEDNREDLAELSGRVSGTESRLNDINVRLATSINTVSGIDKHLNKLDEQMEETNRLLTQLLQRNQP